MDRNYFIVIFSKICNYTEDRSKRKRKICQKFLLCCSRIEGRCCSFFYRTVIYTLEQDEMNKSEADWTKEDCSRNRWKGRKGVHYCLLVLGGTLRCRGPLGEAAPPRPPPRQFPVTCRGLSIGPLWNTAVGCHGEQTTVGVEVTY